MIGTILASGIGFLVATGALLIRDQKALLMFIGLSAVAAFLSALSFQAPEAVLGLVGLAAGSISIKRGRSTRQRRVRLYRSRKRLEKLEEGVREVPKNVLDIVPVGSKRGIHPKIVELILLSNDATIKGYAVEEPEWLSIVRQYYTLLGPASTPSKTLVVSEHEVVNLEP